MKTIIVNLEPVRGPNLSTVGPTPTEFLVIEKVVRIPLDWNVNWTLKERYSTQKAQHVFMQGNDMLLATYDKLVEPNTEPLVILRFRYIEIEPSEKRGLEADVRCEMTIAVRYDYKAYDISASLADARKKQHVATGGNGLWKPNLLSSTPPVVKWTPTLMLNDIRDMMAIDVDKLYKEMIRKLKKGMK